MQAQEHPPWLEFLGFGDSKEVRFPLILLGCAVVGFATLVEAADGWDRHLEHIVPFSLAIALALAWRWRLSRRYPEPLGPM